MTVADILGCARKENERPRDDFFETPLAVTAAFARAEWTWLDHTIWEPFAGNDAIGGFLEAQGHRVIRSDLNRKTDGDSQDRIDFLLERKPKALCMVSNPPFIFAHDIILHALNLGIQKMALLLKADFFNSQKSADIFEFGWKPARILALSWRPDFRKQGSPTMNCSWYIWDRKYEGQTIFSILHKLDRAEQKNSAAL